MPVDAPHQATASLPTNSLGLAVHKAAALNKPSAPPSLNTPSFSPTQLPDLRRANRGPALSVLLDRAANLRPHERTLIESVYLRGLSIGEVAVILGLTPSTARRRIRTAVKRCCSAEFACVLANLDTWPATTRKVATAMVLYGWTMRKTSVRLGLSMHVVRSHRDAVNALVAAAVGPAKATSRPD